MSISLANKKNTKIVSNFASESVALIHHGSETCRIDSLAGTVTLSLCGWDTLTTRGKINAFLRRNGIFDMGLSRIKGETRLERRSHPLVPVGSQDIITIRLSDLFILQA